MATNTKEISEKYGGSPEDKRIVAEAVRVVSDSPDRLLVQGSVDALEVFDQDIAGDEFKLAGGLSFFKKIFKDSFTPHKLKECKFYVMAEVPRGLIEDYIVAAADRNDGTVFEYTDKPIEDELTAITPRINVHDEDEGGEDGE